MNAEIENTLFKYEDEEYIYYYPSQEVMDAVLELNSTNTPQNNYRLLLYSTFVINTRTNEIIKNRHSIEEVIDIFIMNKEE